MPSSRTRLLVAAALLAAGPALAGQVSNGVVLNGTDLNGTDLNGTDLNGTDLNGTDLNGTDLNGVALHGAMLGGMRLGAVHLEGSALVAISPDGTVLAGEELVGMVLRGLTEGDAEVLVRIDGFALAGDVARYDVSFRVLHAGFGGGWHPVCAAGPAIALAGVWNADGSKTRDPERVTFACPGGALAKCVRLGYAPWRTEGETSLDAHHQACTRAMRADYCGNGSAYTQNGHPIDIYDALGIQVDTESWIPEAEWDEAGAVCLSGAATRAQVPVTCEAEKLDAACASDPAAPRGLLFTELP